MFNLFLAPLSDLLDSFKGRVHGPGHDLRDLLGVHLAVGLVAL